MRYNDQGLTPAMWRDIGRTDYLAKRPYRTPNRLSGEAARLAYIEGWWTEAQREARENPPVENHPEDL